MVRYDPYTDRFIVKGDTHMIRRPYDGAKIDGGVNDATDNRQPSEQY